MSESTTFDKEEFEKFKKELEKDNHVCPHCGRCPVCGRRLHEPYYPYPDEYPSPWPAYPRWYVTYTSNTSVNK